MSSKEQKTSETKARPKQRSPKPAVNALEAAAKQQVQPATMEGAGVDPGSLTASNVLQLQRTIGNRVVGKLLTRTEPRVQPKLQVGPSRDQYEQEADRVAVQVMSAPTQAPAVQRRDEEEEIQAKPLASTITSVVQRKSVSEEDELQAKFIQRDALPEEEELQTKSVTAGGSFAPSADFESRLVATSGSGSPLPDPTRDFMEQRFGTDFSGVHLHTGSESAQLNREISAQAFTQGQDIYLGEGKEDVESSAGKQLLAHELTHTIQQGATPAQRKPQPRLEAEDTTQIQRHSNAALEAQIKTATLEDEETVQPKRDYLQRQSEVIQRHPMAPNVEVGHEASFGTRQTARMMEIATNPAFIRKIRTALINLITTTLSGNEAEVARKVERINTVEWELDGNTRPLNPAQVAGGQIKLFYYHANWYKPDGSPRVEFIKSVMIHEGLHYISHNHQGFQELVPDTFNKHSKGELAGADTLDEAVTDRIGAELAGEILQTSESYTTNYWNLQARNGLDFHMTFEGLERLAKGNPKLWLGEMIDVIHEKTGLKWPDIKKAYLSDETQDPEIRARIESSRAAIEAEWKTKSERALKDQLGEHAIAKAEWQTLLEESAGAINAAAQVTGLRAQITRGEIKKAVEKEIRRRTHVQHEIVESYDIRSSSINDWKVVKECTPGIDPRSKANWSEAMAQAKWGAAGSPKFNNAGIVAAEASEKSDNPHTKEWQGAPIPDLILKEYVRKANVLLGKVASKYPMGWVIVPPDPAITAGTKFKEYPQASITLLQPELRNESLSSLMGANPIESARSVLMNMGGGGYEANGEFAALIPEHVNYATVIHEMGHHKQNKELGFNEQSISQIKGVFPLLDLHNILISENRIAAQELARSPGSDPYVRLRYTEGPVRLKVSDWGRLATGQVEGTLYKQFKARLTVKGGKLLEILNDIERELSANPLLYPGNVPALFKNMMVTEILQKNPGQASKIEKGTDIGHK